MCLRPDVGMILSVEHTHSLRGSLEESKKEVKAMLTDHRAGPHCTSRFLFWTRLKVGESLSPVFPSCFLEGTEQNLGNKILTSSDLWTAWCFFLLLLLCMKIKFFWDVCEIYKPNFNDFKLCHIHEPFLSRVHICVMLQSISFYSWILCTLIESIDSMALYSQLVCRSFIPPCPCWRRC